MNPIGSAIRNAKRLMVRVWDQPAALRLTTGIDALIVISVVRAGRIGGKGPTAHVLLNSPSGGNIGDQAMYESFVRGLPAPVIAVMPTLGSFPVPGGIGPDDLQVVTLPSLVLKYRFRRFLETYKFARVLLEARSFSIVGADVMDGSYNGRAAVLTWGLAIASQRAGIPTQVLGFSWSDHAASQAIAYADAARTLGVRLISRDPNSASRLMEAGIKAVEGADIAFSLDQVDSDTTYFEQVSVEKRDGRAIALVNMSALIGSQLDQRLEYLAIVNKLNSLGLTVVMVPHVSNPSSDDIGEIESARSILSGARCIYIDELLTPGQIQALASQAEVIISGRMHLAVLGLGQGVPSIVLATHGKVSGLADLFKSPYLAVEPEAGFGTTVCALVEQIVASNEIRAKIASNLQDVRLLSSRNFDLPRRS